MFSVKKQSANKKRFTFLRICLSVLAGVLAVCQIVSCDQESLFAQITDETKPNPPMISGSQTNIVMAQENGETFLYVAGIGPSEIHRYGKDSEEKCEWTKMESGSPNGRVIALASAGNNLYALSGGDVMNARLYVKDPSGAWRPVDHGDAEGFSLQSIYGAGETLFAGGKKDGGYNIFYLDDGENIYSNPESPANTLKSISPGDSKFSGTAELKGVAESGSVYYIAAGTNGVYRWAAGVLADDPVEGSEGNNVTGINNISGRILAVTWGGSVLELSGDVFALFASGPAFTGAMALWEEWDGENWTGRNLLLLGVHSDGRFNKGYRELALSTGILAVPGTDSNEVSSISADKKPQYDASVARNSIYSIVQVPEFIQRPKQDLEQNGHPVIFATTVNGLYRLRDNEWNTQE